MRTKYLKLISDRGTYRKRVKSHCDTPPIRDFGFPKIPV